MKDLIKIAIVLSLNLILFVLAMSCLVFLVGCDMNDTNPKYTYIGGEVICFYGDELRKCSNASMEKIIEMDIKPLNGVTK